MTTRISDIIREFEGESEAVIVMRLALTDVLAVAQADDEEAPPLIVESLANQGWDLVPRRNPGQLRWKFDGGRGAMIDAEDRIVGYWSPGGMREVAAVAIEDAIEALGPDADPEVTGPLRERARMVRLGVVQ